jgi:OOP family OmpA-OmpF porin
VNNLNKIALAAAVLSASFAAQAQEINPSWYIQPSVAAMKPDSDFVVDKTGPAAGLKFGKALNQDWDLQVGTTYGRSKENGNRYQQNTFGVDGLYMFSRQSFRPFFLIGAGVQRDKLSTNLVEASKTSPYAAIGLGFQADINDRWSAQVDARDVHGFLRGDAFPSSKSDNFYITVGLNYALGAKPTAAPAPAMTPPPPPPEPVAPPPPPPPPARFEKISLSSTELFSFDSAKLNPNQPKLDCPKSAPIRSKLTWLAMASMAAV